MLTGWGILKIWAEEAFKRSGLLFWRILYKLLSFSKSTNTRWDEIVDQLIEYRLLLATEQLSQNSRLHGQTNTCQ